MNLLLPTMIAALLVAGMGVALLGSLKVPLARRLQIDEAKVGGLVSLFGFVMIPVILIAGFLTDSAGADTSGGIGKPLVLCGGCLLTALSLVLLSRTRTYANTLCAVILFSASWAVIVNVGNVLTPEAFGGGDEESRTFAFNLANVFFGLGAFLTPMTIAFLIRRSSFTVSLSCIAGVCLLPAALAGLYLISGSRTAAGANPAVAPAQVIGRSLSAHAQAAAAGPMAPVTQLLVDAKVLTIEDPGLVGLIGHPMLWLCGLALFFYGPLEASLAAWTTTYLSDQGVKETTAANLLSGFWLAFMAGRLITALVFSAAKLPAASPKVLILGLALACIVLLLGFVLCRSGRMAMVLVLAAGLVFGPIFPTLMGVLLGTFPQAVHGRAVGFFFAIGGIGWTIVPMLIGIYAKQTSVQRGFLIAVGAAAGLSAIALAILFR